jgi:hypothetical protein
MDVTTTHHIDSSEPDAQGKYEWRYEYDLYRFSDGEIALVVRSYVYKADEAHFLRLEIAGEHRMLRNDDLSLPLFIESVRYLRNAGKRKLQWLSGRGNGYEVVN